MAENNGIETLESLRQQQKEIERKIASQMKAERNKRINNIVADMLTYEISLDDVAKMLESKQKAATVRYINPKTGATWSGVGKRPKWLLEELAKGKNLQDFSVK